MTTEIEEQLRIEQMRTDIARKTQEMMFEPRKYRLQFSAVIISVFVVGSVIGGVFVTYINTHQPPPQPIIIQVPK